MTTIYANFQRGTIPAANPWAYNEFTTGEDSTGTLKADLLDDSGVATGIGLEIVSIFAGVSGIASWATSGVDDWTEAVFDSAWHYGATDAELQLTGLTDGDSYDIEIAGHSGSVGRNANFTVEAITDLYTNAGSGAPNGAISFSGTISGTTIDIGMARVSVFGYLSGIKIIITPAVSGDIAALRRRIEGY